MPVPYLSGAYAVPDLVAKGSGFPLTLPFVEGLDFRLDDRATIFVGENGSGKSTLLEALAELVGLPWDGGGGTELADSERMAEPRLAHFMRPRVKNKPRNKFFVRAEAFADFARLLEKREKDPDFWGDPYALYGGKTLRARSHGEGIAAVLQSHDRPGLYFFDEPESGLSPKAQLALVKALAARIDTDGFQFVIATHSPLIMTLRGARIISLDGGQLRQVKKEETTHWQTYAALFK